MKRLFTSILRPQFKAFLGHKHSLGFRYQRPQETLKSFDRHVGRCEQKHAKRIDLEGLIESWLARSPNRKPISVANDLRVIRQFCLFRQRHDPSAFVPDRDWSPVDGESHFVPHIFSRSDIKRMLRFLRRRPADRQYRRCLRLLLLVIYCTGLRFGEVARLRIADLDLRQRMLWVRLSKGRTRLVPFGSDLGSEFRRYLNARPKLLQAADAPLFVNRLGRPHSAKSISHGLRQLFRRVGLKGATGRIGPRPYDLRHTFAVHRLSRWHRQGLDVTRRLPWLSVYMGHANILGTETYLTTTPELLALASRRFEARFKRRTPS